ncbi:protease pro-enzyme activation domain-containing protein [Sandaracinus amylolyticus]|uniref:Peptidase S53 domain-containing protein n=1 Tax=Sandaracinus amylolyticus TaxID=927083 RepID=A0A0F6W5Q7_9BACT|nr:protease pro-enzyme activation domain-containing protein [Sandaracinus amylolyticus]AKF07946.1 Hypothetical protein DB32_005095 [Sandaracinus amylolyticus]
MRLTIELAPRDPIALRELADAVSDPKSPQYGAYLDRAALEQRVVIDARERAAMRAWLGRHGASRAARAVDGPRSISVSTDAAALTSMFGAAIVRTLIAERRLGPELALSLPEPLRGRVRALALAHDHVAPPVSRVRATERVVAPPERGIAPADVRRGYRFDPMLRGRGETIAVMALGGVPRAEDLDGFWRAHDVPLPEIDLVPLTALGACASDPSARFETTMSVQWIGALAPAARVVVYVIDPALVADPWSTFLEAVLDDAARAPTIAVTSWSTPERQHRRVHGREGFAALLDQAAVLGVSVIAASGDWGACGGFPRVLTPAGPVCASLAPHATFPGCEARVLSVGGTQVIDVERWRERAWSAPVSDAIRDAVHLPHLASSGGFSETVAIPAWQRDVLAASYARSDGTAVVPHGRAQPDVALAAWGPAHAYRALLDDAWRDDAGGTSLAAPIWAAILACANEARRRVDRPRVGHVAPLLYAMRSLHPITEGATDLDLPALDARGRRTWKRVPGYVATSAWSPATGLGVPDVGALVAAITCREEPPMRAAMYQRKHVRSPNAAPKDYDFIRLPMQVDVAPLVDELERAGALPYVSSLWKWHRGTRFCVLRAGPPGALPGDELITGKDVDAPILATLPRVCALLDEAFPVRAPLAWIGLSPARSQIRMHVDNTQHWDEHHRIHVPLVTTPGARLMVSGGFVHMPAGSVWAFNNSRPHGAINTGPDRLHLVIDLASTPEVEAMLARGERVRGERDRDAVIALSRDPLGDGGAGERPEVLARMRMQ